MKKIFIAVLGLALFTSCYDTYLTDFDYDAIYTAYQYDLRSIVVGEKPSFDFGFVYGGARNNDKDRVVNFAVDNQLLSEPLTAFGGTTTALDGLCGNGDVGVVSQTYVSNAFNAAGLTELTPLPTKYYSLSSDKAVIVQGMHSGAVTLEVNDSFFADQNVGYNPYYAFGFKITSADADTVLLSNSFEVIGLRTECRFFGVWKHSGVSTTNGTTETYHREFPCAEGTEELYSLSTVDSYTVQSNYMHRTAGSMFIEVKNGKVKVYDAEGNITDNGSNWNEATLLQDREIYLNYKYTNADGAVTTVKDTLAFRDRVRDGVDEYQDEDPSHYTK